MAKYVRHNHYVRTHYHTWDMRGFLPEEQYRLVEVSADGATSRAMMMMRSHRARMKGGFASHKSAEQNQRIAVVRDYIKMGVTDRDYMTFTDGQWHFDYWNNDVKMQQFIGANFFDYYAQWKQKCKEIDPDFEDTPRIKTRNKVGRPRKAQQTANQSVKNKIDQLTALQTKAIKQHDMKEWDRLTKEKDKYYNTL